MDFWRQMDIVNPGELPPVTVIGAGGIGSFAVLALAKMGLTDIALFDDDEVEEHNIPNQLHAMCDIGEPKVYAVHRLCKELASMDISPIPAKANQYTLAPTKMIISCVDSMAARKEIWQAIRMKAAVPLYIEARMGAEVMRVYSVHPCDPDDIKFYEETLYDDAQALPEPCTARAIVYTGFIIAGLIASQVKKWVKREPLEMEIIFDVKSLTLVKSSDVVDV